MITTETHQPELISVGSSAFVNLDVLRRRADHAFEELKEALTERWEEHWDFLEPIYDVLRMESPRPLDFASAATSVERFLNEARGRMNDDDVDAVWRVVWRARRYVRVMLEIQKRETAIYCELIAA